MIKKGQNVQKDFNLIYSEHQKSSINYAEALKQLKYAEKQLQLKKNQIKVANLKANRGNSMEE